MANDKSATGLTVDQALALVEQERLDVLTEGASEQDCNSTAAYVLASAVRKDRKHILFITEQKIAAQDEADRLRAEVERLRQEVKHNSEGWDTALDVAAKYLERAERVEADHRLDVSAYGAEIALTRDRATAAEAALATARKDALEEAKKCCTNLYQPTGDKYETGWNNALHMAQRAISALAQKESGNG